MTLAGRFSSLYSRGPKCALIEDAEQLARFMQYVDGNVASEVGDLVDWPGAFWARRYTAIVVSDEDAAQVDRFRYILSHGVKENLVERVLDWPGRFPADTCWRRYI
jgi:hypothetical protein